MSRFYALFKIINNRNDLISELCRAVLANMGIKWICLTCSSVAGKGGAVQQTYSQFLYDLRN